MQINISEETAKTIIAALEKQAAGANSTLGEIAAARDALAVMNEFVDEEIGGSAYVKLIGLYGDAERYAYFHKIGDGCFDFTGNKKYASELTREEAAKVLQHKDYYINMYAARDMIAEKGV